MARIKYGSLISEISGSIGSATFQKSQYGNTLRNKPNPRKSSSASQLYRRSMMMLLHQAWRDLTDDQRRQWNQFISYSSQSINRDRHVLLTGHSLFLKYNYFRLLSELAILEDPVYIPMPVWPVITDFMYAAAAEFYINFNFDPGDNNLQPIIKMSAVRNPSLSFTKQGLLFLPVVSSGDTFIECSAEIIALFGKLPLAGETIHYEVFFYSTFAPIYSSITHAVTVVIPQP